MAFALALALSQVYGICQNVEVYMKGVGQREQLQGTAVRESRLLCVSLLFYTAAFVVATLQHLSPSDEYSEDTATSGRLLAEPSETSTVLPWSRHVPIILIVCGYAASQILFVVAVVCCFPRDGRHKEV